MGINIDQINGPLPSHLLTLRITSSSDGIYLKGSGAGNSPIIRFGTTGSARVGMASAADALVVGSTAGDLVLNNDTGLVGIDMATGITGSTAIRMRVIGAGGCPGCVGIGINGPSTALYVNGTVTAITKNFEIPHPIKSGYDLVHSAIEGPEIAVYYRGEGKLENGKAIVTLPDYFDALTRDGSATIELTSKNHVPMLLSADEFNEKTFIVYASEPAGEFSWEVKATRADQSPLQVEKKI